MQESQKKKTSELEKLYERIRQIQLEFSAQLKHDSEEIKHESEAKDREVSFVSIFYNQRQRRIRKFIAHIKLLANEQST